MKRALAMLAGMVAISAASIPAEAKANPPALQVATPPQVAPACDRACLEGYIDRYLDAMIRHEVDPALFAREVRFTENGIQLPFGHEGLWRATTARGAYRFYIPDVETGQVAYIGTVREDQGFPGTPGGPQSRLVAVAIRLKILDGHITEIEQLAIRPGEKPDTIGNMTLPPTGEAVEAMKQPAPVFTQPIPPAERPSREELIHTANFYFDGLQRNDGKGYYPFTDDCVRFENGMDVLANLTDPETGKQGRMTCKRQFEATLKGVVTGVRDRRFVAVDRERGIVFAFAFFDHAPINWTWQLAELFRIENGRIRRIEAVFQRGAYGINSGWSTYEQGRSEKPQIVR